MNRLILALLIISGAISFAYAQANPNGGNQGPAPTFVPTNIQSLPSATLPLAGSGQFIVNQLVGSAWSTRKVTVSQAGITINGQSCPLGGACSFTPNMVNGGTGINGGSAGNVLVDSGGILGERGVDISGGLASYPVATSGLGGLGTGVANALANNVGSPTAFVVNGGDLGTPTAGILTNATGLPVAGIAGLGTGVASAAAAVVNGANGLPVLNASGYLPATPEVGITGAGAAAAGNVGELIASDIPTASAVVITSATPADITSVSLTAGAWACWGNVVTKPAGSTVTTALAAWLSQASATVPTAIENGGAFSSTVGSVSAGATVTQLAGTAYLNVSSPVTLRLSTNIIFNTSTMAAYGYEACRRVR